MDNTNNDRRRLEHCKRCGHRWFTRKTTRPKVCGRCRSPYWDTPKKNKQVKVTEKIDDVMLRLDSLKKSLS